MRDGDHAAPVPLRSAPTPGPGLSPAGHRAALRLSVPLVTGQNPAISPIWHRWEPRGAVPVRSPQLPRVTGGECTGKVGVSRQGVSHACSRTLKEQETAKGGLLLPGGQPLLGRDRGPEGLNQPQKNHAWALPAGAERTDVHRSQAVPYRELNALQSSGGKCRPGGLSAHCRTKLSPGAPAIIIKRGILSSSTPTPGSHVPPPSRCRCPTRNFSGKGALCVALPPRFPTGLWGSGTNGARLRASPPYGLGSGREGPPGGSAWGLSRRFLCPSTRKAVPF